MNKIVVLVTAVAIAGCAPADPGVPTAAPPQLVSEPTYPDVRDIVGIELGKELVVPECDKERSYGSISYKFEASVYPCFRNGYDAGGTLKTAADLPRGPQHNGVRDIELGSAAVPYGVSSTARILMIDGIVEEVTLDTDGTSSQERLYAMLAQKFGKPARSGTSSLQNAMGARFSGIEADWQTQNMRVAFYGVVSPDRGIIRARTPKGHEFFESRKQPTASSF